MENKNIIMLKHPPMNLKYDNPSYTNQVDDDLSEYIVIDVTSRILRNKEFMNEHPTFAKDLSPFFIGPLVASDGEIANIFEHYWQCSKVYPCHYVDGKITPEFFEWRKKWYAKTEVSNKKTDSRYPCQELGHSPKDCLFSVYYDGNEYQKLGYIEARKKLYIKEYAKLIYNTESFKWLKSLVDSGKKIALVDFDAYNYYSKKALEKRYDFYVKKCKENKVNPTRTLKDFLSIKTIKDVINCEFMLAGHGFAIKMLLQGDISVNADGTINDPQGLLEI